MLMPTMNLAAPLFGPAQATSMPTTLSLSARKLTQALK